MDHSFLNLILFRGFPVFSNGKFHQLECGSCLATLVNKNIKGFWEVLKTCTAKTASLSSLWLMNHKSSSWLIFKKEWGGSFPKMYSKKTVIIRNDHKRQKPVFHFAHVIWHFRQNLAFSYFLSFSWACL